MSTLATVLAAASAAHPAGGILDPIAKPIAWVLAGFYAIVPNYGIAIMLLSVLWMIIIAPLTLKTTRSMLAMQRLQPQLKKLQEQHRNDRQAFAQAQMELFKEHNVSPFGSCLPSILPLPVFIALFRVISGLSHHSAGQAAPKYLSAHTEMYKDIVHAGGHLNAFGMDLSQNALSAHSSFFAALPFYVLLLAMMGTQYYQTVQMMSRNPAAQQNSQARMMKFLPLIFGVFCARFPAGVVLYYAMSNLCRIVQQAAMYRYDPKVKTLAAQEVIEVEAKTRDIDKRKGPAGNGTTRSTSGRPNGSGALGRSPGGAAERPPADAPKSRFRDLLAKAAEQQTQARAAKPQSPAKGGARAAGTPAKNGAPNRNGTPAKDGPPNRTGTPAKSGTPAKGGVPPKNGTPNRNGTPAKKVAPAPTQNEAPNGNGTLAENNPSATNGSNGGSVPQAATGGTGRTGARGKSDSPTPRPINKKRRGR